MYNNTDYQGILQKEPQDLLRWLVENFSVEIPASINNMDDMKNAGEILLLLSGNYSYLMTLLSWAKVKVREAKRSLPKEKYEDMVDRRDAIQIWTDSLKQNYNAVSRSVTIYIENSKEMNMSRAMT